MISPDLSQKRQLRTHSLSLFRRILVVCILAVYSLFAVSSSFGAGQSNTWSTTTTGTTWNSAANWGGTNLSLSNSNTLNFGATATNGILLNDFQNDQITSGTIVFSSGAPAYTLVGNEVQLGVGGVINNSTNLETINLNLALLNTGVFTGASGNISVGGVISGAFGLTKSGADTLTLSGNNTYTGVPQISAGAISVNSIGNSGSSSPLGTNGTINSGSGTSAGTLIYTGPGETTNKVINLNGTTGGAVLEADGTGALIFNGSDFTASGAGVKTLTLQGTGTGEIDGKIVNSSTTTSLMKTGAGTWTLAGASTYTGTTQVVAGNLVLDFSKSGAPANNIVQSTGTLALGSTTLLSSGTLTLIGQSASTNTQMFSNYSQNNGAWHVNVNSASSGTMALYLLTGSGVLPAVQNGYTVELNTKATGSGSAMIITSATCWASGLIANSSGYTLNGTDFLSTTTPSGTGGTIIAYTGYSTVSNLSASTAAAWDIGNSNANASVSPGASIQMNTAGLRFSSVTGGTVTISGTGKMLDFNGGGVFGLGTILVSSAVSGSTLITGSSAIIDTQNTRDLKIIQNSAYPLQIDAIVRPQNGLGNITKSGSGTLIMTGGVSGGNNATICEGSVIVTATNVPATTVTGTFTAGITTVTMASTTGLALGELVSNAGSLSNQGIGNSTYITALTATTVTLSAAPVETGTGPLYFTGIGGLGVAIVSAGANQAVNIAPGATLQLGIGGTTGELYPTSGVGNSGTLIINRSGAMTFNNPVSGTGALVISNGVVSMGGLNTYTGMTNLQSGTLVVGADMVATPAIVQPMGFVTGNTVNMTGTSTTITVSDTTGITVGMQVSGTGIYNGSVAGPVGNITTGTKVFTITNGWKVYAGMAISGTGMGSGNYIASVDASGTVATLAGNASATVTGGTETVSGNTIVTAISGSTVTLSLPTYATVSNANLTFGVLNQIGISNTTGIVGNQLFSAPGMASGTVIGITGTVVTMGVNYSGTGGAAFTGTFGAFSSLSSSSTINFSGGTLMYATGNTKDYSGQFGKISGQQYSVNTNGQNVTWASALTSSNGSFTKVGPGTLTLPTASTYSGSTIVTGGTVVLSGSLAGTSSVAVNNPGTTFRILANNALNTAATVSLQDGTLDLNNTRQTLGALTSISGASNILMGSGTTASLAFADSSSFALAWSGSGTLTIQNWNANSLDQSGITQIFFGNSSSALTVDQLSTITFLNPIINGAPVIGNYSAGLLPDGELIALSSIPEPGTWAMLAGGFGIMFFYFRVRRKSCKES